MTTADALHVVCPHCDAVNRVPAARLAAGGRCGSCRGMLFSAAPLELTTARFARHLERSDIPLLVDFWASWCGPCKMMAPVFAQAAQQLEPAVRLVKINTEQEQELAGRMGIRSIPTLVLFRAGREVARLSGALDLRSLLQWTQQNLAA